MTNVIFIKKGHTLKRKHLDENFKNFIKNNTIFFLSTTTTSSKILADSKD